MEKIEVWFCELHGPVARIHDRKEIMRHRNKFSCGKMYDKKEYLHDTETNKWYEAPIFVEKDANLTAEMQGISNQ